MNADSRETPRQHDPRRQEEPRQPGQQTADAARTRRTLTHLVDPYDMRAEPQQEEPGYGHGV
jgi:hypothetical protein